MAELIPFAPYMPDLSPLGRNSAAVAYGCMPTKDGWGPFKSFQDLINALPAACRGYTFARRSDGSIAVFAGTVDRLYLLDNTTFQWTDVSKGGVAYSALAPGKHWQFRQYNDLVLAAQINTVPQKFTLSSASQFADLGGSPPQAAFIAVVNRFVVLTGLLSNPRRIQWCDLDAPETWTAGTGLADFQDLADGGSSKGLSGGDSYGVVFQEAAVRRLTYAPGSPAVFQIVKISEQDTLFGEYSPINVGDKTFYASAQGFKMIEAGGLPQSIGKDEVDATFFRDVDTGALGFVIGAVDPAATRVCWSYKSITGQVDLFDKILFYDFILKRWGLIIQSGEYIAGLSRPGQTLESLDPVAPTPLTITGAANNGSGAIRLTLSALSNANFSLGSVGAESQNFIRVYGITGGTTEANGTWDYTIIDATHIDLIGSTFVNAYVSGGKIGGSLDALPFSLDSVSTAAIAQLSIFNSAHRAGFFSGLNMEAVMETADQDGKGSMLFVDEMIVDTDAATGLISIGHRKRAMDTPTYTAESGITVDGMAYVNVEDRYLRCRMRIPAASTWTYAKGVQPTGAIAGEY